MIYIIQVFQQKVKSQLYPRNDFETTFTGASLQKKFQLSHSYFHLAPTLVLSHANATPAKRGKAPSSPCKTANSFLFPKQNKYHSPKRPCSCLYFDQFLRCSPHDKEQSYSLSPKMSFSSRFPLFSFRNS